MVEDSQNTCKENSNLFNTLIVMKMIK